MAFLETPRFPDKISYGAVGGAGFKTIVTANDGGYEQRLSRWQFPLHTYDIAFGLEDQLGLDAVKNLFMNVQGMQTAFRFKDWSDYTVTVTDSSMVEQATKSVFQLGKNYIFGALTSVRDTVKIVDATYSFYLDGVLLTEGFAAGNYSIDITTGLVTIVATSLGTASDITNANPGLVTDTSHGLTTGDEIVFPAVAGMTEVNDVVLTVTVIDANSFTIGVDTTNYGVFTSGGSWRMYTQSDEVLTAAFEYDVPVRFGIDQMQSSIDSYNNYSWGQIPLVEIR